jgi:hypothetical protein
MLEKGDKVRFIDEALEGTVTALIGEDRAQVQTSDGFNLVASVSQLVKVRTDKEEKKMATQAVPIPVKSPEPAPKPKKEKGKIFAFSNDDLKEEIIYAAFELLEPQSPLASAVQLHLINNTDTAIAFSLSRKFEMRDEGIAIDKMEPRSMKSFFTYTQDELKLFEAFRIQFLFHPGAKAAYRAPLQKQFRFNPIDLLESAEFNVGNTNSLFIPLADLKKSPEVDISPLVSKFAAEAKEEQSKGKVKISNPFKKSSKNIIYSNEKIVDLHIEELVKDYAAMSNAQIISLQLKHFQYEMDKAILNHLHKITFIHGVGEGVLKSAIREDLKNYQGIDVNDAPVEKFGYGATEVVFK